MAECSIDTEKWPCSRCTYLNFQNSIKCNVCLSPRCEADNSPLTIEAAAAGFSGSDYSFISHPFSDPAMDSEEIDKTTSAMNGMLINDKRWACPSCTYLNCLRTKKCVQCYTDRPLRYSSDPSLYVELNDSPRQSPPTVQNSPTLQSPVDTTLLLAKALKKWSCPACTFLNWPNASRCTMCEEPKIQRPSLGVTIRNDTSEYEECDGWRRSKLKRKKKITKP